MKKYYNTSLRNLTYRLRKFNDIIDKELQAEIMRNEKTIVRMVAKNQLFRQGIEGRGIKIASYMPYAESTKRRKRQKRQPVNRVTLKDKGQFYEGMHVVFDSTGFYVTSDDYKTPYLVKRYGTSIFRLTDENLNELMHKYIRPHLAKKLKSYIKNGRTS